MLPKPRFSFYRCCRCRCWCCWLQAMLRSPRLPPPCSAIRGSRSPGWRSSAGDLVRTDRPYASRCCRSDSHAASSASMELVLNQPVVAPPPVTRAGTTGTVVQPARHAGSQQLPERGVEKARSGPGVVDQIHHPVPVLKNPDEIVPGLLNRPGPPVWIGGMNTGPMGRSR